MAHHLESDVAHDPAARYEKIRAAKLRLTGAQASMLDNINTYLSRMQCGNGCRAFQMAVYARRAPVYSSQ